MSLKIYLLLAFAVFVAATTGADVFARVTIAGESIMHALSDHIYWAAVQAVGTALLLAPFVAVAFLCARFEKVARTRSIIAVFTAAMAALLYFYFEGHQAAQHAALERMWTAATLSIGLLPFFIGIPAVLLVLGACALAETFDHRPSG